MLSENLKLSEINQNIKIEKNESPCYVHYFELIDPKLETELQYMNQEINQKIILKSGKVTMIETKKV